MFGQYQINLKIKMIIKNLFKKKKLLINKPPLINPKSISIEISDTCNLQCRICNQWKEKNKTRKLKFKHFKKLINELSESFNDTLLEFSGPEPLTNKKVLFQALEYAKKRNVKTAISTNGSLISKDTAIKLINYNPKHISLSLDSHEPKIQDYIRNCKGLFDKNIISIKNLIRAKKELDSKTIISVTCTITNYNTNNLLEVYNLCESLDIDSINYNAYVIDNSYFNKGIPCYEKDEFWVEKENIPRLKKSIISIIKLSKKNKKPTIATPEELLKEIPNYFQKKELFHKGVCKAGLNYFHITNFGEVTICGKGPHLNIKDYSLKNILGSENFSKTLTEIKKCKIPCLNNCFYLK